MQKNSNGYVKVPLEPIDESGSPSTDSPSHGLLASVNQKSGAAKTVNGKHGPGSDGQTTVNSAFDFSSAMTYSNGAIKDSNREYRSIFTYTGGGIHVDNSNSDLVVPPNMLERGLNVSLLIICYTLLVIFFPLVGWFAVKKVEQHERLVVMRLGRLLEPRGPGRSIVLPLLDQWQKVDLRNRAFSVPPQHIFTADGGVVALGCEVLFRVKKPVLAVTEIKNLDASTRALAQVALMKKVSKYETHEIERRYPFITSALTDDLNSQVSSWGMEISRIDLPELKIIAEPPEKKPTMLPGNIDLTMLGQHMLRMASGAAVGDAGSGSVVAAMTPAGVNQPAGGGADTCTPASPVIMPAGDDPDDVTVRVDRLLNRIQSCLQANESLRRELDATFEFCVSLPDDPSGEAPLVYHISAYQQQTRPTSAGRGPPPGAAAPADVRLSLSAVDLRSVLTGEQSPFQAYMSGRVQVEGETAIAMRLRALADVLHCV